MITILLHIICLFTFVDVFIDLVKIQARASKLCNNPAVKNINLIGTNFIDNYIITDDGRAEELKIVLSKGIISAVAQPDNIVLSATEGKSEQREKISIDFIVTKILPISFFEFNF